MLRVFLFGAVFVVGIMGAVGCGEDDPADALGECPSGSDTAQAAGKAIVTTQCTNCHKSTLTGAARNNAPADLNFDVIATVEAEAEEIYEHVNDGSMPPAGALSASDKEAVRVWLACGAN